jgi:outer membrane protein insertion porin family
VYRRDVNTNSLVSVSPYSSSSYGAGLRFGIPLNEKDTLNFGLAADFTQINLTADAPNYIDMWSSCNNTYHCSRNSIVSSAGWTHDSRDSIMYTTSGVLQRLNAEVSLPVLDLQYYKLGYKHAWFKEVYSGISVMMSGEVGYAGAYGSDPYPFFKKYYMGGVSSVRGYDNGALGPKTTIQSTGYVYSTGGTKSVLANAELLFPVPGLKDNKQFRISLFLDAGQVYDGAYNLGDLRYSTGVGIGWSSPFGPLKLIYAKPLNSEVGDRTQTIQFQLGQTF